MADCCAGRRRCRPGGLALAIERVPPYGRDAGDGRDRHGTERTGNAERARLSPGLDELSRQALERTLRNRLAEEGTERRGHRLGPRHLLDLDPLAMEFGDSRCEGPVRERL